MESYISPTGWISPRWQDDAVCGGQTAEFFEPYNERPSARRRRELKAKAICARCPVRLPCRETARHNREWGIWGGETDEERAAAGYAPRGNGSRRVSAARPPDDGGVAA